MNSSDRWLIVNADDFGRSPGVNAGVIRCHEQGIVTSATLMVRWPDAVGAGAYAARRIDDFSDDFSVGLHLDLGEWYYTGGEWRERYTVAAMDDEAAVEAELDRQLDRFVELVGRPPTHLDSHQHVHRDPLVGRVVAAAGRRLGVPVRDQTPHVTYSGLFYGQDGKGTPYPEFVSVDALVRLVAGLPAGTTELGCHPGLLDDVPGYGAERMLEADALCDPRVRAALAEHSVTLRSFVPPTPRLPA